MTAPPKWIFFALLAAVAAGCDIASGISRVVTVEELPGSEAVTTALLEVPGMTSVERETTEAATSWSPFEGIIRDPAYDQYTYRAGAVSGVVKVRESEDGERTLELYQFWLNFVPPRAVFDETRRLMDVAYESLRRHAPGLPPASSLEERLYRYPGN